MGDGVNQIAIKAEGLSKQYRIAGRQERYRTLRDTLADVFANPFVQLRSALGRSGNGSGNGHNTIWALKDVSFEIQRGEVVGIIGHNGAGKSTLLRILSRITEPTLGHAEIHGRVNSLLEVGTGFHPELTGRENITLNGAILGMKRAEIERKYDQILAFAGVEKFSETPVKYYSSGMYLRLAFAVAAHMEPEILLVDEVLAVGDAMFQKKCIGKMGDIAAQGRTVLFVSHNLGAVKNLCKSAIVIRNGMLDFQGSVTDALARYSRTLASVEGACVSRGTGWRYIEINDHAHRMSSELRPDEPLSVRARLDLCDDFPSGFLIFLIEDAMADTVVHHRIRIGSTDCAGLKAGTHRLNVSLPALWLSPGVYTAYFKFLGIRSALQERHVSERAVFEVPGSREALGRSIIAPRCSWEVTAAGVSQSFPQEMERPATSPPPGP